MADDRLIVALDVSTMDAVKEIVLSLGDSVSFYKVGMELFYAEGAKTIRFLQEQNKQVFLDLKLHDIPNTVAHGVASLTRLGASLITLHGQGGPVMMKAAVEAARESGKELGVERPKLLAITALALTMNLGLLLVVSYQFPTKSFDLQNSLRTVVWMVLYVPH